RPDAVDDAEQERREEQDKKDEESSPHPGLQSSSTTSATKTASTYHCTRAVCARRTNAKPRALPWMAGSRTKRSIGSWACSSIDSATGNGPCGILACRCGKSAPRNTEIK